MGVGRIIKERMKSTILISIILILSMLSHSLTFTVGEENSDPLGGGEDIEPLDTLDLKTMGSTWEPVVVTGSQIPDLYGTPVNSMDVFFQDNDILVYIWVGATDTWKQIPFQVDERNPITGDWAVNYSNGFLDGKDEIVFMSKDAGDRAYANEWVVGCDAPRYEIEIIDPDSGNSAWAYIYKSSRIEANFIEDYIRFDKGVNDIFTDLYTMGFRNGVGMVMDYLNITEAYGGDGKNLVDTLEFEAIASLGIFKIRYDENDLGADFSLKKDGYVRGLGAVTWHIYESIFGMTVDAYYNFTWKFYPEHVNATGYIDIYIDGPLLIADIWMALDHNTTSIPMNYRDLGGNTAVINGIDDEIIIAPEVQGWWEVSSPHGGYVCVWNIDLQDETSYLKFDDNSSAADHVNATPGLYGRTGGFFHNITHEQLGFGNISFFPIASDESGVAEAIAHNVTHPLLITVTAQHSPTIRVEKSTDTAYAGVGEFVTYAISFNNTGDRPANIVWINDTLPLDVTFFGHDADASPYFFSFNQIGNSLYFEFMNVPQGVHYFNITVTVSPSAIQGQTLTNWVYCNFTNDVSEMMPETSASASFEVSTSNSIILKQGWNLISIPFIQSDTNLVEVLLSIDDLYDAVQWYNLTDTNDPWKHFKVGKPFGNDLFELDEIRGFWVHIIPPGDTIFPYNGTEPTVNQTIALHPGWNMVGYPSLISRTRDNALNNIIFGSDVDAIWTFNAATQTWEEIGPTDYFELGRGYWIHSKGTKTWDVPL